MHAMEQHGALLKNLGQLKPGMETDWLTYSDVLMTVCADMIEMQTAAPALGTAAAPAGAVAAGTVSSSAGNRCR